ncbi:cellulose-binding protein [Streptomyces camponoticapitis]|uniref:Cellulose-binding protein n=1 Tax=Streptomyces camponoticapitis TaxID=1616125 RepID=A0ABQ2EAZ7_9ACTN|nr:cellulose-binding protein [Streptomyces camponoticapitis]GGK00770.1 cellulose-binding protein [Streptomyces camponoticapitis]
MNDASVRFELVRRGYDSEQVDDLVTQVVGDRDKALARIAALEQRIGELTVETENAQPHVVESSPSFAGLGARVDEILWLVEEEAAELGEEAREAARDHHKVASDAAERIQTEAEAYMADLKTASDRECARIVEKAQAEADRLYSEAHENAQATGQEADGLFEDTRARAAHAAADFEAKLAKRRQQAGNDLASRQSEAEERLQQLQQRAEQLRLEAEKRHRDAEHQARQLTQNARHQSDEAISEANAMAVRIRTESERELAALANRRDSIKAQLTNVRAMLATLTGPAVIPDTGDHDTTDQMMA